MYVIIIFSAARLIKERNGVIDILEIGLLDKWLFPS
jgi:hypothetical protein